jgi:hypothetical protein
MMGVDCTFGRPNIPQWPREGQWARGVAVWTEWLGEQMCKVPASARKGDGLGQGSRGMRGAGRLRGTACLLVMGGIRRGLWRFSLLEAEGATIRRRLACVNALGPSGWYGCWRPLRSHADAQRRAEAPRPSQRGTVACRIAAPKALRAGGSTHRRPIGRLGRRPHAHGIPCAPRGARVVTHGGPTISPCRVYTNPYSTRQARARLRAVHSFHNQTARLPSAMGAAAATGPHAADAGAAPAGHAVYSVQTAHP